MCTVKDLWVVVHPPQKMAPAKVSNEAWYTLVQGRPDRPNFQKKETQIAEMMALAIAKWDKFLDELAIVDQREFIDPESSKWDKIAIKVDVALVGQPHINRGGLACKYKWQSMVQEFKKIANFHNETSRRGLEYFDLTTAEKMAKKPLKNFYVEVYSCMN
jgi:hypothetical protein